MELPEKDSLEIAFEEMLTALVTIRKADEEAVKILRSEGFEPGPESVALWKLADDAITKAKAVRRDSQNA